MNTCVITPRRTYIFTNSCVICGFPFIVKEHHSDGNVKITKHLNRKLRLSYERLITPTYDVDGVEVIDNISNRVWVKCVKSNERVMSHATVNYASIWRSIIQCYKSKTVLSLFLFKFKILVNSVKLLKKNIHDQNV